MRRFGWKARTRSLQLFAAEAYLVEEGLTNELYPEELGNPREGCRFNTTPENRKNPIDAKCDGTAQQCDAAGALSPSPLAREKKRRVRRTGEGCWKGRDAGCSTPELRTGRAAHAALAEKPVALYSDLLLHRAGWETGGRRGAGGSEGGRVSDTAA